MNPPGRRAGLRVVLSTGLGRLHLVQSACHLLRAGVDVQTVQGWVPWRITARLLGALLGKRSLASGMAKRRPPELAGRIRTCAVSEFAIQGLFAAVRLSRGRLPWALAASWGWRLFGWQTRRHLHGGEIFHVRSGAGQGGAIQAARRRGMRVVVDQSLAHPQFMDAQLRQEYIRQGLPFELGPESLFWQLVLQDCAAADLLLVNSDFVKETFCATGYPAGKIRVVYLGVRADFVGLKRHYERSGPLKLLFTGTFGFRKGAEYLLQALQLLEQAGVACTLTVVGSHVEAGPLLRRYPIQGVQLVGHVPQEDLKQHLAAADIYVFPSLAEGCACSGMEALAAGLPVVATRESGLPIRDGETGFLVPAKDAASLADRIARLARNSGEMERVGRAAAALVAREFTWPRYAENVAAVYRELIS